MKNKHINTTLKLYNMHHQFKFLKGNFSTTSEIQKYLNYVTADEHGRANWELGDTMQWLDLSVNTAMTTMWVVQTLRWAWQGSSN